MSLQYKPSIVVCPFCESVMDNAVVLTGMNTRPSDGDVSLCYECGQFMQVKIHMERLSEEDLSGIPQEFHTIAARIAELKKARGE